MNRYPLWKYAILVVALLVGLVYTVPNFFGEAPAVQVSSAKATLKLDASFAPRVQQLLEQAGLKPDFVQFEGNSVKARLPVLPLCGPGYTWLTIGYFRAGSIAEGVNIRP